MKMFKILLIVLMIGSCVENPTEPPKNNKDNLVVLWKQNTNIIDAPSSVPLIINNKNIIYSGEIELVSLNIDSGEEVWRGVIDDKRALESRELMYDNQLERIISNHFEEIKVWDAKTGVLVLSLDHTDELRVFRRGNNTLANEGYAFVGDTLDAYVVNTDGSVRFKIDKPFGTSGIAYYQNKVFVSQVRTVTGAFTQGKIRAFDSITGDSLWIFETDKGGFDYANSIIENNILYNSTIGNSPTDVAVALNAETGEVIWEYESDYLFTRSTTLGPKYFYVNTGGSLAALNKENGQLEWRVEWMGTDFNKPVYLEGYVYHVRDFEMLIIDDNTGKVVHREPVPDGTFFWHVAASSDKIFAQTSRQLIAYKPWHLREGD